MCMSQATEFISCGHVFIQPIFCQSREFENEPCPGWGNRIWLQALDGLCRSCAERIPERPARPGAASDTEEPLYVRRGSLADRYRPTPPPELPSSSREEDADNEARQANIFRQRFQDWVGQTNVAGHQRVDPDAPVISDEHSTDHESTQRDGYRCERDNSRESYRPRDPRWESVGRAEPAERTRTRTLRRVRIYRLPWPLEAYYGRYAEPVLEREDFRD